MRGDLQEGHFYASRCHLPIFPSTESAFLCALPVAYLLQRRRPRHGRDCCSAGTAARKRQSCAGDYELVPQRRSRCEGSAIGKLRGASIGKDARCKHREAARHHREARRAALVSACWQRRGKAPSGSRKAPSGSRKAPSGRCEVTPSGSRKILRR